MLTILFCCNQTTSLWNIFREDKVSYPWDLKAMQGKPGWYFNLLSIVKAKEFIRGLFKVPFPGFIKIIL